jgi:hypothetical protein
VRRTTEGLLRAGLVLAFDAGLAGGALAAAPAQAEANAFAPVAGIFQYRCAVPGCHTARDESVANRSRWGAQVTVGRRMGDHLSLLLVPTYVWRTRSDDARDDDGTGALGVGAEWRLTPSQALTAE